MPCQFLHKSNSVAVNATDTALVITFLDNPQNIANMQRFCFCIQQTIPADGLDLPVEVTVNGTAVSLLNKYGNDVIGSDLVTRYVLKGYYGTDNGSHVITASLPKQTNMCNNNCYYANT